MTDMPPILYKYRMRSDKKNKKNENHQRILTHNEIFFSSPRHFNDPFDCRIMIDFFDGPEENKRPILMKSSQNVYPDLDPSKRQKLVEEKVDELNIISTNPAIRAEKERLIQEKLFDYFGVFSMSMSRENILLWSHYSDSHKGFCVGLDTKKLTEHVNETWSSMEQSRAAKLYPVKYQENYPNLSRFDDSKDRRETLIDSLTIKSKDWEYEQEYRLILMNGTNHPLSLPDDAIVSVCFGSEMSQDDKKQIWESIKSRSNRPHVFQAKRRKKAFGLEFEELSY